MPSTRSSRRTKKTDSSSVDVQDAEPPVRRASKRVLSFNPMAPTIATRTRAKKTVAVNGKLSNQDVGNTASPIIPKLAVKTEDDSDNEIVPQETENCNETSSDLQKNSCPQCNKNFSAPKQLEKHLKICDSDAPKFTCDICNKSFTRSDNLKQHARKHTEEGDVREKKYECEICMKMFFTPSHLQIHLRTHTGERPFKCDECSKSFSSSGALNKHSRIHTGEKPFKCPQCNFAFALKGTLNRHMKIHSGIKPHKCEFCGKEFIQSGGLKAHMFFHTGQNGFKCELCDRQFNRKARLEMHKRYVHEKVKPFACTVCGKCFTRKEDLNRHSILHTGEKPHKCQYCTKSFALKASLNVHLLTHRKEEPRACHQCGHAFIRKDCLVRHIRKIHRDQASILLLQHNLVEKDLEMTLLKEDISDSDIYNGKLNDDKLCHAIRELLILLVDEKLLKNFGWPNSSIDSLLEAVIKQCNHEPVKCEDYNYFDRLRENVKLLFTAVIEDDSLKELLNNKTVDEVIVNVIMQANA
ncbi:hypothetical protein BLOT_000824 [Blomia tropicalis]|nr:hypothetical protein BLOT_000824 [Blomia tropicalis]